MKKTEIKPVGDRVLVKPITGETKTGKSKGGIIIPDTVSRERPEEGRVLAVGPGRVGEDGKLISVKVKKGQHILFTKYGPEEIKIDGEELLIVSESNILAIIE